LRDKQHELLGFGVIMRDATERHNHLELLRQSEERLRLMIETVQDYAIFMLDPLGNAASWNSGAQNIKGYSSNEIIGRHFSLFYTPEDVATGKPREEFATANACGRVEDEGWRVRRDRSRFWANVMITAVHDEVGTLRGFAKITRDMTERTQLIELERSRELAMQFQSTREDEQRRIARELHDDLGQQLTALKMGTALLEGNLIASDGARHLASQTHDLQKEIDSMMASIRRIASDLRPPVLDDLGLLAAIDWLADDLRHRYGVVVSARLETGDLMFNGATDRTRAGHRRQNPAQPSVRTCARTAGHRPESGWYRSVHQWFRRRVRVRESGWTSGARGPACSNNARHSYPSFILLSDARKTKTDNRDSL
jgi:PAS domain S-box-containing protein